MARTPSFPADLLSFFIGAAVIGNAYFIDADTFDTCQFLGDLRLEAKALSFSTRLFRMSARTIL